MGCGASTANTNVANDEPLLQHPQPTSDEQVKKEDLHSGEKIPENDEKTEEVQQIAEEVIPEPVVEEVSPMVAAAAKYKEYLNSRLEPDPIKFNFDRAFALPFAAEVSLSHPTSSFGVTNFTDIADFLHAFPTFSTSGRSFPIGHWNT